MIGVRRRVSCDCFVVRQQPFVGLGRRGVVPGGDQRMRAHRIAIGLRGGGDVGLPGEEVASPPGHTSRPPRRSWRPNRNGPPVPKRSRAAAQIASIRAMSASAAVVRPSPAKSRPRFIHIAWRSPRKPACISAAIERAWARAIRSCGHSAGAISAQYSQTDSNFQTRAPRCSRYGTRPLGESWPIAGVGPGRLNGISSTSTSSAARRTASQPRNDHDE